jgi:hypothetical protein
VPIAQRIWDSPIDDFPPPPARAKADVHPDFSLISTAVLTQELFLIVIAAQRVLITRKWPIDRLDTEESYRFVDHAIAGRDKWLTSANYNA